MSEKPFIPTSNYPRRAEFANKAKAHAKAALAVAACLEAVSSLHFFGGVLMPALIYLLPPIGFWALLIVGAVLNLIQMKFLIRYERYAGWSHGRVYGSCGALAIASALAFVSPPLGFLLVGLVGAFLHRGVCKDLEAMGLTTRGFGMPKMELRRIIDADPYEVTPLG